MEAPLGTELPHEPRPVAVLSSTAKLAICGQAPGTRVHASGVPFTDPSGDRLRDWMGIDSDVFYDSSRLSIVPMGFCFPGLDAKGSDLPPRRECANRWHGEVFDAMPQIELILAVGLYAQKWHLGNLAHKTLSDTVADWRTIMANTSKPAILPLPHPSWRNNSWIKKRPWFSSELLPELRGLVRQYI
ncbi:MAG: uracil-DNA glycosylase family protein [Pseudomonadota bacterium]